MATLQNLLAKGYFPRELPPPFNTESFATHALATGASWNKKTWTRCVAHNLARPGGLRRPLKIPNPISNFGLAEIIANNWISIRAHTWHERLSASRPHVMKSSNRAVVPRYRYGELPRLRALRRRGSRYLLHTDINQFYPALYTHTIPWALHGKAICKAALSAGSHGTLLLGNRIDKALQCMNEGQTHGIPIGPDASLVVAEILLSAVDTELLHRCAGLVRGFRYVDDFELSFSRLSDAEQVLTELQGILASYELSLNPRKTRVEELPSLVEDIWASELAKFPIRDPSTPVGQRNDLIALFNRAFESASKYPEESVLRYAIARLQNEKVHAGGWRTFQNYVLGAASADASTLAVAFGTLYQAATKGGHTVSKSPLAETIESIIDRHARREEGSEVAWAIWGSLAWGIPMSAGAARSASVMEDDIVALLALDADARGLFPHGQLDKQGWTKLANEADVLHGDHWLLAYEANQQHWLSSPAVVGHPVFSPMSQAGVSFYDPARNSPQFPAGARGFPGGSLPSYYA